MAVTFALEGVGRALANIAKLEVGLKAGEEAMANAVAAEVLLRAKSLAPVLTGRLQGSLSLQDDPEAGAVRVGTSVPYAPYVEYGTANMAAGPFLRPAADGAHSSNAAATVLGALIRAGVGL